jgi:hypothetical protein
LATGLISGPSIGYFWIGRTSHALLMTGLRLLTLGAGAVAMSFYFGSTIGDSDNGQEPASALLATSIIAFAATMSLAFVDAALVGRAADRANAKWREKNKPSVTVAPIAWSNGNGDGTFGLAVSGAF